LSALSHERALIGAYSRSRDANDPALVAARQNLAALQLERAVHKALAKSPRPTDEQLQRIAGLLLAGGGAA
jgi:hypothetical protein